MSHHKDPWYPVTQQESSGHRRVIKHCFLLRRVIKFLFLLFVVASTMKPILQLIDMEESDPGALLNNEHLDKAAKKNLQCPAVWIDNEPEKDPVNIFESLKHSPEGTKEFWLEKQDDKAQKNIGIRLPAAVHPPNWEFHEELRKKIIEAALNVGVELIKFKVVKRVHKNLHQHFTLRCKHGRKGAPEKPFVRPEGASPHKGISNLGVSVAEHLPGCRLDPMINKKQGIRGTKGEGKSMVRRTGNTKPADEHDEHVCPVKFKFALIPGECW